MKHWGPCAVFTLILATASAAAAWQSPPCTEVVAVSLTDSSTNPDIANEAVKRVLCNQIEAGQLDQIRWPNFSDYRSDLKSFYQPFDNAPAWIEGGKPTAQALAMIALLHGA